MNDTSAVDARIDRELKENAESILARMGISPSGAIQTFYRRIVSTNGRPFASVKPVAIGGMSREQLDSELRKGFESLKNGQRYSREEVEDELRREFGM